MRKFKSTVYAIVSTSLFVGASFNSFAMDEHIESALIEVCKSAQKGNLLQFKNTTKSFRLSDKNVAMKVMCNGDDIIDFASKHGSVRIAEKLEQSIGGVSITDMAAVSIINVTFAE
ncbi:MAG: DUF3718 domain-containing protein [Colwellia sp.]|nr:DUF3718 domain-containing protein [Colwellia sp.]